MSRITQAREKVLPIPPHKTSRRALVVEDQTTFRELLAELIETDGTYQVDTCPTCGEAQALLERQRYDLVVLDLMLPDAHGFSLMPLIRANPGARVLVLTAQARANVVKDAVARGAHGVVTKSARLSELREAIDRLSHGGVFYSSESTRLIEAAALEPERDQPLTGRQLEILRAVASGLSTKEIASILSLSEKTVANHRARIMQRLGMHDVASLTRHAVALGLIDSNR
jgi:DNA-binding NarL/FixJ family response regulator